MAVQHLRILVVDDERAVRESLRRALELEGYEVEARSRRRRGARASSRRGEQQPDAVVLDVLMPGVDGLEVCRRLRRAGSALPVLDAHRTRRRSATAWPGLDAGADDYVVKPVRARRAARARARAAPASTGNGPGRSAPVRGSSSSDPRRPERHAGRASAIELTRTEFNLLELFLRNPRQVLTRSVIFERVWGYDFGFASNSLDVYIGYLRRKTEAGGKPRLIQTVRGVGYALREAMSFRVRLTLVAAAAVALAVVLASARRVSSSFATSCAPRSTKRLHAAAPARSRASRSRRFRSPRWRVLPATYQDRGSAAQQATSRSSTPDGKTIRPG